MVSRRLHEANIYYRSVPQDKELLMYDFYVAEYALYVANTYSVQAGTFKGDTASREISDSDKQSLLDALNVIVTELKKGMLDAVYLSISAELIYLFKHYQNFSELLDARESNFINFKANLAI